MIKAKSQVKANYHQAIADGKKEAVLMTITKKDLKKKLSTSSGFGTQDLTKQAFELVTWIVSKHGQKVSFIPKSLNPESPEIEVRVKI